MSLGNELQDVGEQEVREDVRIEKDLLGTKTLPANAYYGINSVRAAENYTVSGYSLHPELIIGLAMVKKSGCFG